jgi:hypothetical protein
LFGWGGGVIARIPPVPAVGGRVLDGERRSPFAIAGADIPQMARSCKLKKSNPAVGAVNSTLVCGKPARGVRRGRVFVLDTAKINGLNGVSKFKVARTWVFQRALPPSCVAYLCSLHRPLAPRT